MNIDLIEATSNGDLEMVQLLLENGANIEARDQRGETALMMAIRKDDLEMVQLLLEHGANIEARDQRGETALMIAVYYLEMVQL